MCGIEDKSFSAKKKTRDEAGLLYAKMGLK
jgi:hypothetical protein